MKSDLREKQLQPNGRRKTGSKTKAVKFWRVDKNIYSRKAGIKFLNEDLLTKVTSTVTLGPPAGKRGFHDYPEPPMILIDKKLGRPPADMELFYSYWLISSKAKNVFESFDAEAFAFCKCDMRLPDGTEGPEYWLCDILRMLDAVDEENSEIKINDEKNGTKWYDLNVPYCKIKIREDIDQKYKVFRLLYVWSYVICDESFKVACKELTNIRFYGLND